MNTELIDKCTSDTEDYLEALQKLSKTDRETFHELYKNSIFEVTDSQILTNRGREQFKKCLLGI